MHQLQPLRPQLCVYACRTGRVAARPVQARDEPNLHRVGPYCEYDWNGRRRRFRCQRRSSATSSYKHRNLILSQLRSKLRQSVRLCPSIFDLDVLAVYVACRAERLSERTDTEGIGFSRIDRENADHRYRRLLGPRHDRPRRQAADRPNEPTPPQFKHGAAPSRRSAASSAYHRVGGRSLRLELNCSESRLSTPGLPDRRRTSSGLWLSRSVGLMSAYP